MNGTIQLYVNGQSVASKRRIPDTQTWNASGNFVLGNRLGGSPTDWWKGGIDNVRPTPGLSIRKRSVSSTGSVTRFPPTLARRRAKQVAYRDLRLLNPQ